MFESIEQIPSMPPRIVAALRETWSRLARPGTWWTGEQKVALAGIARSAFAERGTPPWMRTSAGPSAGAPAVDAEIADLMVTLAADAARIDRAWAEEAIAIVGDAAYVELVAIAATMAVVDAFAEALGVDPEPLPPPIAGEPSRTRPDGMGDIGAYVDMAVPWSQANVARALTLCPTGSDLYRGVGAPLYHDGDFLDLDWDHPLSRPQAELIATTVSAVNECFY